MADAFTERLRETYNGEERIPYILDGDPYFRNVKNYMRMAVDETLTRAATEVVAVADPPRGTWAPPDQDAISKVRDAMSEAMIAVRGDVTAIPEQRTSVNDWGSRRTTRA